MFAPDEKGRKSIKGTLVGLEDGNIVVSLADGEVKLARSAVSKVKTVFDFGD